MSGGPRRGGHRTRDRRAFLGLLPVAIALLTGCGSPVATPSPSPPSSPAPPIGTASPGPTSGSSPTPVASGAVAIDSSLLSVLPATVDGLPFEETPDQEAAALADPLLGEVGTAIASGLAIDAPTGQFVYAVIVRLRPGVLTADSYRDWRDSYDEGACSQAGGVAGNAEAEIDGRTVYIGTCDGGVRTYHAWLEAQGLLVSASAVGDRRLGEVLVGQLTP